VIAEVRPVLPLLSSTTVPRTDASPSRTTAAARFHWQRRTNASQRWCCDTILHDVHTLTCTTLR